VTNHNDCASVSHTKIPSIKANTIDSSTKEEEQEKEDEKKDYLRLVVLEIERHVLQREIWLFCLNTSTKEEEEEEEEEMIQVLLQEDWFDLMIEIVDIIPFDTDNVDTKHKDKEDVCCQ
jgi:hypothetical protein